MSLFGKEKQLNHMPKLIGRYQTSSPFMRRKIILAAAESGLGDWLRELKEDVPAMDPWTKRAYLFAAGQLPSEERKFFLRFASSNDLLEFLVVSWVK